MSEKQVAYTCELCNQPTIEQAVIVARFADRAKGIVGQLMICSKCVEKLKAEGFEFSNEQRFNAPAQLGNPEEN